MGRQFNSLNDVAVHKNGWIYFTDVDYGAYSRLNRADSKERCRTSAQRSTSASKSTVSTPIRASLRP